MVAEVERAAPALPHWDMTVVYPSLESAEFNAAFEREIAQIGIMRDLFDRYDIRKRANSTIDDATVSAFEAVTQAWNTMWEQRRTLGSYISSFVATNSRNDLAQAKMSEMMAKGVELSKLDTRYTAWIGSLDVESLIARSALAQEHAFALRKTSEEATHQMSEAEEDLAASLNLSGGSAWSKLHGTVTSRLMVDVAMPDGQTKRLPMSAVRGLAMESDGAVREAAYKAEIAAWETVADPLAAAMNGIKGQVNTLNSKRGWQNSVQPSLFDNNIDQATLDAMHEACRASFPDFRRYLQAKARLFGKSKLPWWDMFAPVGGAEGTRRWEYADGAEFLVKQFATYSDKLAHMADRAFRENWIDAEPRPGKRDGAFCMGLRADESRIMSNYVYSFDSVHTLAHELGHAYHNVNLAKRTIMQRGTPMALAETASIFCQTIITNAMLGQTSGGEKLAILEADLQDACQVVVDIHSRFLFEQRVFEGRTRRDLSVDEFKKLMVQTQAETYGDGLDAETYHPFMWAVKGHYYSTGRSYYNWPYTFGLLFGLGLYARYRQDPEPFRAGYDELLSSTGLADAAALAKRFDIDIRSVDFWTASLDVSREHVAQFEQLVDELK